MGYPVLAAGMVLAPRGASTMLMMLVAGRLIIGAGLLVTAASLHAMSNFTSEVSQWVIVRTGFLQGVGFGLIFVPLSTVTFATLPPEWRTDATGLFSLMRNLGSSIGISIVVSLLSSNTQVNHASIALQVTPYNPALHEPAVSTYMNAWTAAGQGVLNALVTEQAEIIAYADDYRLMMFLTLAALPTLLLMRSPRRVAGPGPAHAAVAD